MKKIVVPTDFSTCANNAVDFAVRSAKILPAEIILVHAFEVIVNAYTDNIEVNNELYRTLLDDTEHKLQQLKKSIQETEGIIVSTKIYSGTVKDAIVETAVAENADLIVMGTLGASGLKEKLWGSTTSSVIGSTSIPVMAIPDEYKWKKPEKVLFASNHFEKEPAILDYLFEMADLYKAQVEVAVMTDVDDDRAETFLEHTRQMPQYERFLKKQYKEETITATHLYGKEFEETLQKHIRENEIDILVMVTYQKEKSFWYRLFHPGMTKRMSYHTNIPLLAIPAK